MGGGAVGRPGAPASCACLYRRMTRQGTTQGHGNVGMAAMHWHLQDVRQVGVVGWNGVWGVGVGVVGGCFRGRGTVLLCMQGGGGWGPWVADPPRQSGNAQFSHITSPRRSRHCRVAAATSLETTPVRALTGPHGPRQSWTLEEGGQRWGVGRCPAAHRRTGE